MFDWLKNRHALVLVLGLGMGVAGFASTAGAQVTIAEDHMAAAKGAITATKATKRLDNILPTVAATVKNQLILSRPDLEGPLSDIVDEATIELAVRRGDLENEIARIYATIFTAEELTAIADFYNSPAGQKLLRDAPLLARQVDEAAKTWTAGINRDVRAAVNEKMKAAGYIK